MNAPLPTVDGIGPSCLRVPAGPWKTILEYLQQRFRKVKPKTWVSRMEKGEVVDEHGVPLHPDSPCRKGALIFITVSWTMKPAFLLWKPSFTRTTIFL